MITNQNVISTKTICPFYNIKQQNFINSNYSYTFESKCPCIKLIHIFNYYKSKLSKF
jgi:hypothetical protein